MTTIIVPLLMILSNSAPVLSSEGLGPHNFSSEKLLVDIDADTDADTFITSISPALQRLLRTDEQHVTTATTVTNSALRLRLRGTKEVEDDCKLMNIYADYIPSQKAMDEYDDYAQRLIDNPPSAENGFVLSIDYKKDVPTMFRELTETCTLAGGNNVLGSASSAECEKLKEQVQFSLNLGFGIDIEIKNEPLCFSSNCTADDLSALSTSLTAMDPTCEDSVTLEENKGYSFTSSYGMAAGNIFLRVGSFLVAMAMI